MTHGAPMLDTRSERTRAALLRGFVTLIFRDGYDAISVAAIVTEAGMARSTFYEHFGGKEDILQASMTQFFSVMSDCAVVDEQPETLVPVLEHFWDNRRMADAVFSGHARSILVRSLVDMIEQRLRGTAGVVKPLVPYRLAASQLAEAQLALVDSWLRGRAFSRPENIAAALYRSSRASASALIAES